MALGVYYSDRIEDLALRLKLRLLAERSVADAFSFSSVVVPNANMAKWLRLRAFADAPSLCAGVEFPFIEQALFRALNESLPEGERAELLPMNAYATAIMGILLDNPPAPFQRYLSASPAFSAPSRRFDYRRAWQLAVKLADLMDEYEVRRPEIVAKWLAGAEDAQADEIEAAEAAVARRLFGAGGAYAPDGKRLSLRQLFERVERTPRASLHPPQGTYRLFGLSTLSPLQVRILRWIAKGADVEVYHNNVCIEYWGDIEKRAEERRLRELCRMCPDGEDMAVENPLLRDWGVAGRETMRLLARLEEEGAEDVAFDWQDVSQRREEPSSVLAAVQSGIRRRTGELARREQDASLQVVAAPGLRREVEMVHNAILGQVLKGDSGDFSDIAVLVTDMAKYRPMIESVFLARGQVPFGMVDTSASGSSDCLAAFAALMRLAEDGFDRPNVFAALDSACIQRALGFSRGEARAWRDTAREAGAYSPWESDGALGNFSWSEALSRLRASAASSETPDEKALKFADAVERLHTRLSPLAALRIDGAAWADTLAAIVGEFIDTGDDEGEEGVRRSIFDALYSLRDIAGRHPLAFAAGAVEEFACAMKHERGGYLTRGVTVAGLQPMRPVPFRTIFVLGMGEDDFPGRQNESTLDMRGATRRLGDASVPIQNRYVFLETLMAARDRLVISYLSLDTQKDAEKFPSGMVGELEKFVTDAILPEGGKFREIPLPLLERGEEGDIPLVDPVADIEWRGWWAGIIPTYSNFARTLARKVGAPPSPSNDLACVVPSSGASPEASADAPAGALQTFLASPLEGALRKLYGIRREKRGADEDDSPLELPSGGGDRIAFDERVLAAATHGDAADALVAAWDDMAAHGRLPKRGGFFGDYSLHRCQANYGEGFLAAVVDFAAGISRLGDGAESCLSIGTICDDPEKRKQISWPPFCAIGPFIEWLERIAASESGEDEERSFVAGVVDFAKNICAAWEWKGIGRAAARRYLDAANREFRTFLETPGEDGKYLSMGWRTVTAALEKLKLPGLPGTLDDEGWQNLCDAIAAPYRAPGERTVSVVAATLGSLERLPTQDDWRRVRDFCVTMFSLPMQGARREILQV